VTTLADGVPAPAGSLRACAEDSGPRTCVFRVGGAIELKSGARFEIKNPYLTIAGQTAPGGGILIKGDAGISVWTHDVIIRYLRFRLLGTGSPGQGQVNIYIFNGAYNVIVDHCSTSWSLDENTTIYKKESPFSPDITNVTFQRCFIAEALAGHGTGLLIGGQAPQAMLILICFQTRISRSTRFLFTIISLLTTTTETQEWVLLAQRSLTTWCITGAVVFGYQKKRIPLTSSTTTGSQDQ